MSKMVNAGFVLFVAVLVISFLPSPGASLKAGGSSSASPVATVLELLQKMYQDAHKQKDDEEIIHAKFQQFCRTEMANKNREIAEAAGAIEHLSADINGRTEEVHQLSTKIQKLQAEADAAEASLKERRKTKEETVAEFGNAHKDLSESIAAVRQALVILKRKRDQIRESLLQRDDEPTTTPLPEAPEGVVYKFGSHHVIEMLEKLLTTFREELADRTSKHEEALRSLSLLIQDDDTTAKHTKQTIEEKDAARGRQNERLSAASSERTTTEQALKEDRQYTSDLKLDCESKADEFVQRQNSRVKEMMAIEEAIKLLRDQVFPVAQKHLDGAEAVTSFIQKLRARSPPTTATKHNKPAHPHRGSLLAVSDDAQQDAFQKIVQLVHELLAKLEDAQQREASAAKQCEWDLKENKENLIKIRQMKETVDARIQDVDARIQKHMQMAEDSDALVTETEESVRQLTEERTAENTLNDATIKEVTEALAAVENAMAVLRQYYASIGNPLTKSDSTSLLQKDDSVTRPDTWTGSYKGLGDHGGVMNILEIIQSQLLNLKTTTEQAEAVADDRYHKVHTESQSLIAEAKERGVGARRALNALTGDLHNFKEDAQRAIKELDLEEQVKENLQPRCVDAGESFASRTEKRAQEIEDLKTAIDILSGRIAAPSVPSETSAPVATPTTPSPADADAASTESTTNAPPSTDVASSGESFAQIQPHSFIREDPSMEADGGADSSLTPDETDGALPAAPAGGDAKTPGNDNDNKSDGKEDDETDGALPAAPAGGDAKTPGSKSDGNGKEDDDTDVSADGEEHKKLSGPPPPPKKKSHSSTAGKEDSEKEHDDDDMEDSTADSPADEKSAPSLSAKSRSLRRIR